MDAVRTNMPRYFIQYYMGEYSLGIFTPMAYLKRVGNTIIIALGLSATPRLARYYSAGHRSEFCSLLWKMVGISALLGTVGVLVAFFAGREAMTLLYRAEYAQHNNVLVMLMVAAAVDYVATSLDYGMSAARYFRVQAPLFAVVTATAAVACLWLIPSHGLLGAAMAVTMSTLVRAGGNLIVVLHAVRALPRQVFSAKGEEMERVERISESKSYDSRS
jgi:O-antigen/teichoic acid export membrane protein